MPVRVVPASDDLLVAAVSAVEQQGLLGRYHLGGPQLLALLRRGQAAGDVVLVASAGFGEAGPRPCGLLWGMARGAFASAGYLRLLLVSHEAMGRGVGRALVTDFESRCEAPKGGFFALTEAQAGVEGFYRKLGYGAVGTLPGFVRAERTEVLLWKCP